MPIQRENHLLTLLLRLQRSGPGYPPFEDTGITPAQFSYLDCIARHPQITLQEMTMDLDVSAASVSNALKNLEQAGFLQREPNPHDGRSSCFVLSENGKKVHVRITRYRQQKAQLLLKNLSETDQEAFLNLFEQLLSTTSFINPNKE